MYSGDGVSRTGSLLTQLSVDDMFPPSPTGMPTYVADYTHVLIGIMYVRRLGSWDACLFCDLWICREGSKRARTSTGTGTTGILYLVDYIMAHGVRYTRH